MLHSVLIRTLREGVTLEDFVPTRGGLIRSRTSTCDSGWCTPALDDPRKVISIGFHDVDAEEFMAFAMSEAFAQVNEVRHARLAPLIEEAESGFTGVFEVVADEEIAL